MMKDTKYCGRCGVTKPVSCFHRNVKSTDGRQPFCISCRAQRDRTLRKRPSMPIFFSEPRQRPTAEEFRDAKAHGMALALFGIIG